MSAAGLCRAVRLTRRGCALDARPSGLDPSWSSEEVLIISALDGVGGLHRAWDLLALERAGAISIEIDRSRRRAVRARWPDAMLISDIRSSDDAAALSWRERYHRATRIILGGGFPCRDMSGLRDNRRVIQGRDAGPLSFTKVLDFLRSRAIHIFS